MVWKRWRGSAVAVASGSTPCRVDACTYGCDNRFGGAWNRNIK